jgi:hypothetical protein
MYGPNFPSMLAEHRQLMGDWRQDVGHWRRQQRMGALAGNNSGGAPQTLPAPANPVPGGFQQLPQQAPQSFAPAGMVGGSYGIPGMTPAASSFDLPKY